MSIVAWFLYSPFKKLVFVPVASATDGGNRDCPVLASVAQWPEIQPLVSGVKSFPLTSRNGRTDAQADNYYLVCQISQFDTLRVILGIYCIFWKSKLLLHRDLIHGKLCNYYNL